MSRFKTSGVAKLLTIIALIALPGCASVKSFAPVKPTIDIDSRISEPKHNENATQQSGRQSASDDARKSKDRLVYYRGKGGALSGVATETNDSLAKKTLQLNFVNAPAAEVARTVIADALGQTVAVANGVSGSVTLTSPNPLPAREALNELERTLAESNLALLETPAGFLLTTLDDASKTTARINGSGNIGYGVTFSEIHNAVPSEIERLIDPFVSDRVTITADDSHGVIILRGPKVEIAEAQDAINAFDAPFLTDRVFGLFKLQYADANTIQREVDTILNVADNSQGLTVLIPLPRLNLIFVAARTQSAFANAKSWIERLDQPSGGDERRLRYYAVQYTPADVLATQLNIALTGIAGAAYNNSGDADSAGSSRGPSSAPAFGGASGNGLSITADELNNALLIRATDREYQEVMALIEKMDLPAAQVMIEATIAEVTLTKDLSYGVRWFFENAESRLSFPGVNPGVNPFSPIVPGLNYSYVDGNVSAALDALASVTDVTILSAPSIVVLNNQSASLQVGDEVPIVTQQAQSVADGTAPIVSTLQLRDTGVILEVTPRINASDLVTLEVSQEVSDVTPTTTSGIDSPTIQQRRFTSTVAVRDNGTIALGGLIRETYTDSESGVPVLKDIPGIGNAFKSRDITKRRTELIVFLTPRIIRTDDDTREAIHHIRREMQRLGVNSENTN